MDHIDDISVAEHSRSHQIISEAQQEMAELGFWSHGPPLFAWELPEDSVISCPLLINTVLEARAQSFVKDLVKGHSAPWICARKNGYPKTLEPKKNATRVEEIFVVGPTRKLMAGYAEHLLKQKRRRNKGAARHSLYHIHSRLQKELHESLIQGGMKDYPAREVVRCLRTLSGCVDETLGFIVTREQQEERIGPWR